MQFAGRHARRPPGSCPRGRLNPVTPHMHLAAWKGGGLLAGFRHGRWLLRSRPEQSPQAVDPRKDRERRNVSRDTRGPSATPSPLPCVRGRRSEQVRRHLDLFRPPCRQTCFDPPRRHTDGVAAAALDIPRRSPGSWPPTRTCSPPPVPACLCCSAECGFVVCKTEIRGTFCGRGFAYGDETMGSEPCIRVRDPVATNLARGAAGTPRDRVSRDRAARDRASCCLSQCNALVTVLCSSHGPPSVSACSHGRFLLRSVCRRTPLLLDEPVFL